MLRGYVQRAGFAVWSLDLQWFCFWDRCFETLLASGISSCVLCCIVSCRVMSCRVVSCCVVSCRVVSCRVVSCRKLPMPLVMRVPTDYVFVCLTMFDLRTSKVTVAISLAAAPQKESNIKLTYRLSNGSRHLLPATRQCECCRRVNYNVGYISE